MTHNVQRLAAAVEFILMSAIAYNLKKLLKWQERKNEYGSDDNKKGGEKPLFFVFPAMATSEF